VSARGCVNGSGKETVLEGTEEENGESAEEMREKGDKKIHAQKTTARGSGERIRFILLLFYTT
jgi:hypothetical protein